MRDRALSVGQRGGTPTRTHKPARPSAAYGADNARRIGARAYEGKKESMCVRVCALERESKRERVR